MFRRVPIIGYPITVRNLFSAFAGLFDKDIQDEFLKKLSSATNSKYIFLVNSGITSFYIILQALKKISAKKEVMLPAYTAPSLVVAVLKAGLKPVLCDISLEDFNADADDIITRMNHNTLCIVGVHMFGIPWVNIKDIKKRVPEGIFVVEDCAQAFGARIEDASVGTFGDVGFYSFKRGKNFPTYEGGFIVTNSGSLCERLRAEVAHLETCGIFQQFLLGAKLVALSMAFRPHFYGLFYPFIRRFKDNSVPDDFNLKGYSSLQASFGNSLFENSGISFQKRRKNGFALLEALKTIDGMILPKISEKIEPVFSRLPVVFKNTKKMNVVSDRLEHFGIETSRLYLRPLHHIFDLGYKKNEFPNAVYFAERLLTFSVHPYVESRDIAMMARMITKIMEKDDSSA